MHLCHQLNIISTDIADAHLKHIEEHQLGHQECQEGIVCV